MRIMEVPDFFNDGRNAEEWTLDREMKKILVLLWAIVLSVMMRGTVREL